MFWSLIVIVVQVSFGAQSDTPLGQGRAQTGSKVEQEAVSETLKYQQNTQVSECFEETTEAKVPDVKLADVNP